MDAKRNRNKMLADTNESGYVWTGPKNLKWTVLNVPMTAQVMRTRMLFAFG